MMTARKVFFAYGSQDSLVVEAMHTAAALLSDAGHEVTTWEDLRVDGRIVIQRILQSIKTSDAVVAEVGSANRNVLFELGYAIAQGRQVFAAVDDSDQESLERVKRLRLLNTMGQTRYGGDGARLAQLVQRDLAGPQDPLLTDLLVGGHPREANTLFAPVPPLMMQPLRSLAKQLSRRNDLTVLGSSDDLGIAPLDVYFKQIYRSSAAVIHLLAPKRAGAEGNNGRASLLAGAVAGFELPLLLVAEPGVENTADYEDMQFNYRTSIELNEKVEHWLRDFPRDGQTGRSLGRVDLRVELPISTFGEYVAENESADLPLYYVQTSEMRAVLEGSAKVFVGRKGAGKTAAMSASINELRKDKRNLVVAIKPAAYELAGLLEVARSLESAPSSEYVLQSMWAYVLYSEMAIRAVKYAHESPAGREQPEVQELERQLNQLGVELDQDAAQRIEDAVSRLSNDPRRNGETEAEWIGRGLQLHRIPGLKTAVAQVLVDFDRVAILIDNLDKTWERGADFDGIARFILALLSSVGRVEKDFAQPSKRRTRLHVSLTVFLRSDIFEHVTSIAREPDKISPLKVQWDDEELLVRVLDERFDTLSTKSLNSRKAIDSLWTGLFAPDVAGVRTKEYLLWRILPRPRDLIYIANAALTSAINRKHNAIQASDVLEAEARYSEFALDALLVEAQSTLLPIEWCVLRFSGGDAVVSESELRRLLEPEDRAEEIIQWLLSTSFLGLESKQGRVRYAQIVTEAQKYHRVATQSAERAGTEVRFWVHPAFRPFLEVTDTDAIVST